VRLSVEITIEVPADRVWDIVAGGFDDIGSWASAIRSSRPFDAGPREAPTRGHARVCESTLRIAPQVTETLVAYDDRARTFTYEGSGLPSFVTLARNRWCVAPLSLTRCLLPLDATLEVRGGPARTLAPALRLRFLSVGRRLTRDLKHTTPSTARSRRASGRPRVAPPRATTRPRPDRERLEPRADDPHGDRTAGHRSGVVTARGRSQQSSNGGVPVPVST